MSDEIYTFVYQSQGNHTVMVSGAYYHIDSVVSAMEDFLRAIYRLPADEHLEIVEEPPRFQDGEGTETVLSNTIDGEQA